MATVLMIDTSDRQNEQFCSLAMAAGHQLIEVNGLSDGAGHYEQANCDLVVIAEERLREDRNSLLSFLKNHAAPQVVVTTRRYDSAAGKELLEQGVLNYLDNDKAPAALITLLEQLEKEQAETSCSPADFGIAGSSLPLQHAFAQASHYARSEASVLLYGATGTGKELFAKALHKMSARRDGPLVTVDCASLPETLVESMLFGYFRGAFTGASSSKEGLIKLADGGTLFLDEVGELPLGIQSKFLRVLQEHRFRPVGGGQETRSDFRLIAATNRDLAGMVAAGDFREDLYYRLRILHIELPPLAERSDDVLAIAQSLLHSLCDKQGIARKRLSVDLKKSLREYHWPGNVRELVNVVESIFAVARDKPLLLTEHLPRFFHAQILGNRSWAKIKDMPERRRRGDRRLPSDDDGPDRRDVPQPGSAGVSSATDGTPPEPARSAAPGAQPTFSSQAARAEAPAMPEQGAAAPPAESFREARNRLLLRFEKDYLSGLHERSRGNITEACRQSRLSRPRLYELYRKHGILNKADQ